MKDKGTQLFGGIGAANNSLSAPPSEPVRELVEALQKVCDAMRTFQRREQRSYFASDIFEAERVLARYQKREGA